MKGGLEGKERECEDGRGWATGHLLKGRRRMVGDRKEGMKPEVRKIVRKGGRKECSHGQS